MASAGFPVKTRQVARDIAGFPTEILLQLFDDKTVLLVNQGKIGRMLQVSPPTSNRRRTINQQQRRDIYAYSEDENDNGNGNGEQASTHSTFEGTFLPAPDPSSSVTNLFGTSKSEDIRNLEHLYVSQIAAILFNKGRSGSSRLESNDNDEEANERESGSQSIGTLTVGKPVVVGLGFKAAFLEGQNGQNGTSSRIDDALQEQRSRFKQVMELVNQLFL